MTDYRAGESLEKYLENRRFWLEVVLGAVLLGCLVNLFASAIWEDLHAAWPEGLWGIGWTALLGVALLSIIGAILCYLLRRDLSETSGLTLVLPLAVANDRTTSEILHHSRYFPARYGRERWKHVDKKLPQQFAAQWPGPNPLTQEGFAPGHFCWDTIRDLVDAIIVKFLHEFGEHTLKPNAPYHGEFRRLFAARIPEGALLVQQGPPAWKENIFLYQGGPQKIILPQQAQVSINQEPFYPGEPPGRRTLVITTSLVNFQISIAPFWTLLRDRQPAEAVFSCPPNAVTTFLVLPLEIRLILKGVFFLRDAKKHHYLWFQKLLENARRRLSYGYFLQANKED